MFRCEQQIYDKLWQESVSAFDQNAVRLDGHLKNRQSDKRRGVTLLARPNAEICSRVKEFLDEVAAIAPEQHFYCPTEFHMTVLAIVPGSENWQEAMSRLPEYLAVLEETLNQFAGFSVEFRGVTASPEAILIQGFPVDDSLVQLRNKLRSALAARNLAENLDRRYKIATAHLTVARFSSPQNWQPLKSLLAANRQRDFGRTCCDSLQLIKADWYASTGSVETLCEYQLREPDLPKIA
ncbi:MAG TPA: 2'-5' RNA ligase family protein [Verrucomicrobiae bacterium]|nr:2'-5' RNA ligase family protein [Verrucomicrobiae bacterium]